MAGANWAEQVNIKLHKMNAALDMDKEDWEKLSIYKLPTRITDLNKKAYIPQEASFGPYHHGEDHLLPMEEHKERALRHFLKRSDKPLQGLIDCLKEEVEDLKSAYAMLPTKWQEDDNKFIQLMILDGCFMLEILHNNEQPLEDYADHDPIFSRHGKLHMIPYMKRDMLMLENQLPMLVLEKLLAFESEQKADEHLNKLILKLFFPHVMVPPVLGKCLHVLDVYRKNLLQGAQSQGGGEGSYNGVIIPSATELNLAGIQFRKSKTASLVGISFNRETLNIPPIVVDDATESLFLNLIAFERYHVGAGNQVTSYIFFMHNIINNKKDVVLLESHEIIQNAFGSDKAVAELFHLLSQDTTLDPDTKLNEVQIQVQRYYRNPWNMLTAYLVSTFDFFRNRWALFSLVITIILFALTITQTVYTVSDYYKNNSLPSPPPPPPPPLISRRQSSYRHP